MSGLAASRSEASGKFPADAPQVVVQTRCPPLKGYTVEQSSKGAREMQELLKAKPDAQAPVMFRDYGTLRQQCRAYEGN